MSKPITIHILSDSIGETADAVARAVAAQFPRGTFRLERLPKVESTGQLCELVAAHCGENCIFFFTLAEGPLREEMERCIQDRGAKAVDILGPGVDLLSIASGLSPKAVVGAYRVPDEAYYDRIEAMEFAIKHDDGQHPEGLLEADVVLIGVSRTSKTPLAMYLASKGFRVANVPLVPLSPPPEQLFEVDARRVFGLISSVDTLTGIRSKRMDELGSYVPGYAERERVEIELDESRTLMRRIGCLMVRTDNRAIEETAQDIIRYLKGRLQTED